MEIGKQLKQARQSSHFTQEDIAYKLNVSRQTISNWENEKSYPDIIYIIEMSELYQISLDVLLKGDQKMIEHLEESTNVVSSHKRLIIAIVWNVMVMTLFIMFNGWMSTNMYLLFIGLSLAIISSSFLFFQVIKKF